MDVTITTIYCLCDDFVKAMNHLPDDPQARLSTAEVMTIPLAASTFFGGFGDLTPITIKVNSVGEPCFVPRKTPAQVFAQAHEALIFFSTHGDDANTRGLIFRALLNKDGTREVCFERVAVG